jgi:hypothetical protein
MRPANFLRYVLLPALALGAGVKLGIKYAEEHYVVKNRKFIDSETVKKAK